MQYVPKGIDLLVHVVFTLVLIAHKAVDDTCVQGFPQDFVYQRTVFVHVCGKQDSRIVKAVLFVIVADEAFIDAAHGERAYALACLPVFDLYFHRHGDRLGLCVIA